MSTNLIGGVPGPAVGQPVTTASVEDSWNDTYKDPESGGLVRTQNQATQKFSLEDLALMPLCGPPGGAYQFTNYIPPVPGALCGRTGEPGTTQYEITGQYNYTMNETGIPGNSTISASKAAKDIEKLLKKPKLEKKTEKGAEVVRLIEQGLYNLLQNKGLPSSGALSQQTGHIIEQLKNVETAFQQFSQIPGLGFPMPSFGSKMNFNNMLDKATEKQKTKLEECLSPELLEALKTLLSHISTTSSDSFTSSGTVHEETFIENAINLLCQATNTNDLIEILETLQNDTTLHGLENFESLLIKVNTAYGEMELNVDAKGDVAFTANSSNNMTNATNALTSAMGGTLTAGLEKLFGNAGATMADMFNRIPNNTRKDLLQRNMTSYKQLGHEDANKKTYEGLYP